MNRRTEYRQLSSVFVELFHCIKDHDANSDFAYLLENRHLLVGIERHGLTPLLWKEVRDKPAWQDGSNPLRNEFKILAWKNNFILRQRQKVGGEMIKEFKKNGINPIALKGFALANSLYKTPCNRPMADIDFLIPQESQNEAMEVLSELEFKFDAPPANRRNIHHHLPVAWRIEQGERISIECHTNIYSADVRDSLPYEDARVQNINIEGVSLPILCWEQQWLHLVRHQFEPSIEPALKGYMDMALLLDQHACDMDWVEIGRQRSEVLLFARYFAQLLDIEMPHINELKIGTKVDFDLGIPKLSEIAEKPMSRILGLILPSAWWLLGRYGTTNPMYAYYVHLCSLLRSVIIRLGAWLGLIK